MDITSQVSAATNELVISVNERFDFSQHGEFKSAYSSHSNSGMTFVVDLSKTRYMDSSALGMLLVLKEHADGVGGKVILRNPTDDIVNILKVTNFDSLFTIS